MGAGVCRPRLVLTWSLSILLATLLLFPLSAAVSPVPTWGLHAGSYLVYAIDEVAFFDQQLRAEDRYRIQQIMANGSITAEIKWGVAGIPDTPTQVLSGLTALNPADPQLNTLTVLLKPDVPDGVYQFGRSTTRISRGSYAYWQSSFDVIISQHIVYDRSPRPAVQYNGTQYYERHTGVLLRATYRYGPPTFTVGTMNLIETNVFSLEEPSTPWLPVMLGLVIIGGTLAGSVYARGARRIEEGD